MKVILKRSTSTPEVLCLFFIIVFFSFFYQNVIFVLYLRSNGRRLGEIAPADHSSLFVICNQVFFFFM